MAVRCLAAIMDGFNTFIAILLEVLLSLGLLRFGYVAPDYVHD